MEEVLDELKFFIDEISPSVLPLGVEFLDILHVDSGAIFMVKVILLECEHFGVELMVHVKAFEVLFWVAQVLIVLVIYVGGGSFFFYYLCDHVWVVICLRGRVFGVQGAVCLWWAGELLDRIGHGCGLLCDFRVKEGYYSSVCSLIYLF